MQPAPFAVSPQVAAAGHVMQANGSAAGLFRAERVNLEVAAKQELKYKLES
jgi:hypothetical protein